MLSSTLKKRILFGVVALICVLNLSTQAASVTGKEVVKEKKFVLEWLSQPQVVERFGKISDSIWFYAELGMQEYKSSALLADTLEEAGFTVERGAAGMPTCFVATYGSGDPVIGLLGEFDALPMISQKGRVPVKNPLLEGAPGHGCGHNTMCTAAAAAAIAVKNAMDKYGFSGTIKVFGSPAEETLISRPYMIRAGLFDGVDAVIDNHSSSGFSTSYGKGGNAMFSSVFTFKGKTAHGASPWNAVSALDAVELMNVATNYLREHLFYTYRMHYVIKEGGEAPNVVPDKASVWYYVRNSDERVEEMYAKVINCAKAAALATGAELESILCYSAVHQRHANKAAAELIQKNIDLVGIPEWTEEEHAYARALQKELGKEEKGMPTEVGEITDSSQHFVGGGSSDVGDVTLIAPTATIRFPGQVPGAIGHHWSVVAGNYGSTAWKGLNAGAKAIAASAIDMLTKPEELKKLRDEFEEYVKEHPYKPFLPEDAKPPLDLNKELMDKWRPLMEKYYLKHQ
ncbi:MAG TPA: amidohydrolase [Candidatus Heimdallarchaeota archaeon]|nr:amidohydrolase [Candidatus Heimdallarchaeota archaeon]